MEQDYLYEENILEHSRNPKNKVEKNVLRCDCVGYGENIDCGDSGELYLNIKGGEIVKAEWSGNGCALSQAGMSMMTEKINREKVSLEEVKVWSPAVVYGLLGVKISPSRINCALLSYKCLEDALKKIN
jgi:nitrogen fixation NifU-like protein